MVTTLTKAQARRLMVRAQGLTARRPTTLAEAVGLTGPVQVDLTAHVAPSADLVLWSRLGDRFSREAFNDALTDRELVEIRGFLHPASDIALFRADMDAWPGPEVAGARASQARWVDTNRAARDEIVQRLRSDGPLPARELQVEFAEPYRSSGWNHSKSTQMMLERLEDAGVVAVSHREGRERVWDLASRIHADLPAVPRAEAEARRREQRLARRGIFKQGGTDCNPGVGEAGEPVRVEGSRRTWRADPGLVRAELDGEEFCGRTALLSPFDQLIADRPRMNDLFEFDYALEMFKPAETRRFGYYALPVLHGDRLIGSVDAQADREAGRLRVHRVVRDGSWPRAANEGLEEELASLGRMLQLRPDPVPRLGTR